jgi:hypothetical protein
MSVALTPRLVVTIFIGMVSVNISRLMLWTYDYVNDNLELGKPKQYASMKQVRLVLSISACVALQPSFAVPCLCMLCQHIHW